MKFTNGYWMLRDEMRAAYAVEYGSHRVYGQELTMYLPCSHIVDRGSCLNIPASDGGAVESDGRCDQGVRGAS